MSIVVFGTVFVDIKGHPLDIYVPNGRNAGRIEQVHGGVGRNVAEDIANCELRPTFISTVDDTGIGEDVLNKLRRHKVNVDYCLKTADGMGTWLAIFDHTGEVVANLSKRPNLLPLCDVLDAHGDEIFAEADSVVVEIDIDKELVKKIFKLADKYQKTVYVVVSNMQIALKRRDLLRNTGCIICNQQEAGVLFAEDYMELSPEELLPIIKEKVRQAGYNRMVVTMAEQGAVYADCEGDAGIVPAKKVQVLDTTGAGDAFFSGVTIGLTYGKSLKESCEIGTKLASAAITTMENVCPRFMPGELGL
ncbi:MAG: carbohydrate kinase family protein [Lachnospiraceae bacterium]|nr:carbohydrate kinase family protein [Lachnospiraceae bacterium]